MSKKCPHMPTPKNLAAMEKDWPPAGGVAIQVGPETNWTLLALKYGYTNPWDLIRYNFKTTDPHEVNYYMGNKLMCNLVTKDGKNFRFGQKIGNVVQKVTIYIPQFDWSPDPGPAPLPDRLPTDDADDKLAAGVWWVLCDPRIDRINFVINGYQIGRELFNTLRGLIMSRAIAVYKKSGSGHAEYDHETNSLHMYHGEPTNYKWAATALHEMVHAGLDHLKARNMQVLHSEAAAYIVQCWYYILVRGFSGGLPEVSSTQDVKPGQPAPVEPTTLVLQAAYAVATELHMGRGLRQDLLDQLYTKIQADPDYKNWARWCMFDGIRE